MEDNYYNNEIVEVEDTRVSAENRDISEKSVQMMADALINLSLQVAANNEAKFKAQAEVMIKDIEANMQKELFDMKGYYDTRKRQGESFDKIIAAYHQQIDKLTSAMINAQNETIAERIKWSMEETKRMFDGQLNELAGKISGEQETRRQSSKSRRKGLLGFLFGK